MHDEHNGVTGLFFIFYVHVDIKLCRFDARNSGTRGLSLIETIQILSQQF